MFKWLLMMLFCQLCWAESDPFVIQKSPASRMKALKKYQYLGFIQDERSKWALIRCTGGEIEKLTMGKIKGWGKVVRIDLKEVCLFKKNQLYCLGKGVKPMPWTLSER